MEAPRRLVSIGNYVLSPLTIGEGSFSKVKVARHKVLDKNVAMKIIKSSSITDDYISKNLEREAKILSRLHHINVVRLFEVCKCEEFYCLIMEYFPGGSLCDLVQTRGRVGEEQARLYFQQLVRGLSYIHSKGVIHRDLKLENLLLSRDQTKLAIADFGLSNLWSPGDRLKTYCGSPEYAAPELFRKAIYTTKVDVWSAGIVLYTMLTARLPFDVDSKVKNYLKLLVKMKECSVEVKLLLARMVYPNPDERIGLEAVLRDPWLTEGVQTAPTLEVGPELTLTDEETLNLVTQTQLKLGLNNLKLEKILEYLRSSSGWYGKTAGCFNILRREMEKQRDTPPTQPLQPELQKPQLGQPVTATAAATAAPTALLNQQQDKSKRSGENGEFWNSREGKRALNALKMIKSDKSVQAKTFSSPQKKKKKLDKAVEKERKSGNCARKRTPEEGAREPEAEKMDPQPTRTTPRTTRTVSSSNDKKKKKGCLLLNESFRPASTDDKENVAAWRRSIRPDNKTRLKRVDQGDTKPLANQDNRPLLNTSVRPGIKKQADIIIKKDANARPILGRNEKARGSATNSIAAKARVTEGKGTRTPLADRSNQN